MFDISGLIPEAQPVAERVAEVFWKHTQPWFIGLVCVGSAVRGGITRGGSDIDFLLYLKDDVYRADGDFPMYLWLSIQRDLAGVSPTPFVHIDAKVARAELERGEVGPIPGNYHLLYGHVPVPEATSANLKQQAIWELDRLPSSVDFLREGVFHLERGGADIARKVRKMTETVWPIVYDLLALQARDAVDVWCWPKNLAVERMVLSAALATTIHDFYRAVTAFYPSADSIEHALAVIESGTAFLQAAKKWHLQDTQMI